MRRLRKAVVAAATALGILAGGAAMAPSAGAVSPLDANTLPNCYVTVFNPGQDPWGRSGVSGCWVWTSTGSYHVAMDHYVNPNGLGSRNMNAAKYDQWGNMVHNAIFGGWMIDGLGVGARAQDAYGYAQIMICPNIDGPHAGWGTWDTGVHPQLDTYADKNAMLNIGTITPVHGGAWTLYNRYGGGLHPWSGQGTWYNRSSKVQPGFTTPQFGHCPSGSTGRTLNLVP